MKYLLDTDTIIYWLNGDRNIEHKIRQNESFNISFSVVSLAELYYGAYKSARVDINLNNIKKLKRRFEVFYFDDKIVDEFGRIKSDLSKKGTLIGDFDIIIASVARINKLVLVTNNKEHYSRIENLILENWKKV